MLVDEDREVRNIAVKKIIYARQNPPLSEVRKFMKLTRAQINENATVYHRILKWESIQCN